MHLSISEIIGIFIIFVSVILSIKNVYLEHSNEDIIESIISASSTVLTFLLMITNYNGFNKISNNILSKIFNSNLKFNGIIQLLAIVMLFCVIKYLIQVVLRILNSFSGIKSIKNKGILYIFSAIFGFIRGIVIIILLCIPIVLFNSLLDNDISILDGFKPYEKISYILNKQDVDIFTDGVNEKISNVVNNKEIIYYNGVTIEDGVASNEEIDNMAREITSGYSSNRDKAKAIYEWIGTNISYDNEKAKEALSNNSSKMQSGAVVCYKEKSGICFDYACLYTAMCLAVDLKTQVIIGEAYNGSEYISHAWNKVYIPEEGAWINVDSTFYKAGDFFDSTKFQTYHRESSVAGQFG